MTDHQTLTKQDKQTAFMRAVHSMSGAKARWANHARTGLTDKDLQKALRYELGIFGGSGGHGCINIAYQGSGLKIWASRGLFNHCVDEPILQGMQTMLYAREVLNIPNPDNMQMSLF